METLRFVPSHAGYADLGLSTASEKDGGNTSSGEHMGDAQPTNGAVHDPPTLWGARFPTSRTEKVTHSTTQSELQEEDARIYR